MNAPLRVPTSNRTLLIFSFLFGKLKQNSTPFNNRSNGNCQNRHWPKDFSHFLQDSLPLEDLQCNNKTDNTPCKHYGYRDPAGREWCAFVHYGAERGVERGERQGFDERLQDLRKPFGGEERSGQQPHRKHDEVHQTRNSLDRRWSSSDEQSK